MCEALAGEGDLCPECKVRIASEPPPRLGGWLLLALFIISTTPIIFLENVFFVGRHVYFYGQELFPDREPHAILREFAHWGWPFLSSLLTTSVACYTVPRFLRKRRAAPRLMKLFFAMYVPLDVVTYALARATGPSTVANARLWPIGARVFISTLWLLYFSRSERVRKTFVR